METIYSSNQELIYACDDLRAIQLVIDMVKGHPEHEYEMQVLAVIKRSLVPIIEDIQEAIDNIDDALMEFRKQELRNE